MDINKIIEMLRTAQGMQSGAWALVQRVARQYAQVKLHGSYIDGSGSGHCVSVGHAQRERMAAHFLEELLREVERAFLEDALMGQTVQQHLGGEL